jgi:hypothetical protein
VSRRVVAQAVVVATGVCGDGRREVLGFAVGDSEDGAFWTQFLRSLKARGLAGVQLVIADAHLGLRQAVQAVMAGAAIQRCRVHFLRNVLAQVPKGSAEMVAAAIRTILLNPTPATCMSSSTSSLGCWAAGSPSWRRCSVTPPRSCWPSPRFRSAIGRRPGRRMNVSRPVWRCPPVLAWLGSALGVVDPGAKSRAVGLEALPRSFAP